MHMLHAGLTITHELTLHSCRYHQLDDAIVFCYQIWWWSKIAKTMMIRDGKSVLNHFNLNNTAQNNAIIRVDVWQQRTPSDCVWQSTILLKDWFPEWEKTIIVSNKSECELAWLCLDRILFDQNLSYLVLSLLGIINCNKLCCPKSRPIYRSCFRAVQQLLSSSVSSCQCQCRDVAACHCSWALQRISWCCAGFQ